MSEAGQTTTTTTTTAATWHDGFDSDLKSHIANRGWDKLDANAALAQAIKAHREAEKLIGIPAENLLRAPKDANDKENLGKIYDRLGVPKDAKEYDFTGIKFTDGNEPDETFINRVRDLSAKYHLPKDEARALASDLLKTIEEDDASETATYQATLAEQKAQLEKNWGAANMAANKITAQNAAAKLGVTPEQIAELEKSIGYASLMEMFRKIGAGMGEDKFVNNQAGGAGGALTREQAQAKLDGLMKDDVWLEKFNKGDALASQEFHNLTRLVTGV